MKVYKHEGLYEDEESIKMMKAINEQANKSRVEKIEAQKKEHKQDVFLRVFVIASCLFILSSIFYLTNKKYEKDVTKCINSGYAEDICRYELSK